MLFGMWFHFWPNGWPIIFWIRIKRWLLLVWAFSQGMFSDVSQIKNTEKHLWINENYDSLTKLHRYCYYDSSMQHTAEMRQRLIVDSHQALKENQFVLYFQPIIDLAKNTINKAESLIRWCHPEHGMISPADFIPVAEETGLIIPLGNWIFKEAVNQASRWSMLFGPDFQISINKSPKVC